MERADKSRALYLAKLQARGGAYWRSSVKRCAGARAPFQKAHGLTDIELEYLQPVATRRWWGHLEIIPGPSRPFELASANRNVEFPPTERPWLRFPNTTTFPLSATVKFARNFARSSETVTLSM